MRIGILGAGTFGTALAAVLCTAGNEVTLWSALPEEIESLSETSCHKNLPGVVLPREINYTKAVEDVCSEKEVLIFAVPSVFLRGTVKTAAPYLTAEQVIADVAKGIESGTLFTMSEVIADEAKKSGVPFPLKIVALSGPTHAEEVARNLPTTIVSASSDRKAARLIQKMFVGTSVRAYTHTDVKGVELSGAVKNVIAIAAGISAGLGFGDNAKAALITRGMAEIERLGRRMGCRRRTFAGLAGIGDLIVTATSVHSRNNRAGTLIGSGVPVKEAVERVGMVVEGLNALPQALALAEKYKVEMPIVQAVHEVVDLGVQPKEVFLKLMNRRRKAE